MDAAFEKCGDSQPSLLLGINFQFDDEIKFLPVCGEEHPCKTIRYDAFEPMQSYGECCIRRMPRWQEFLFILALARLAFCLKKKQGGKNSFEPPPILVVGAALKILEKMDEVEPLVIMMCHATQCKRAKDY